MADELSAERSRREAAPAGLSGILSSMLDERADASWRVTRAWHAVNGDIERAHTTGTFVREPRRGESGPVLVVYVDSRSRATDFSANSEVYLARLANAGHPFCKVEFRLSKYPRRPPAPGGEKNVSPAAAAAPRRALTHRERDEIESLCSNLPASLRATVSRAMSASYEADCGER